jgi:hypothetical protein
MTTPELYRALADETERREAAERRAEELQQELEALRGSLLAAEPPELLNVELAAKYINKSPSYLHKDRLLKPCRIPYVQDRPAGRVSYCRTDLDRFIASHRRGAQKAA